jgi:hypothetical protein
MLRVFNVTLTKDFDVTVLAESEEEVEALLENCQREIDRDWNPPDWTFSVHDPLKRIKSADKVPKQLPFFDMVVVDGELLSAYETGSLKEKIESIKVEAQRQLDEYATRLALDKVQCKLPGIE